MRLRPVRYATKHAPSIGTIPIHSVSFSTSAVSSAKVRLYQWMSCTLPTRNFASTVARSPKPNRNLGNRCERYQAYGSDGAPQSDEPTSIAVSRYCLASLIETQLATEFPAHDHGLDRAERPRLSWSRGEPRTCLSRFVIAIYGGFVLRPSGLSMLSLLVVDLGWHRRRLVAVPPEIFRVEAT